jgi:hypothetical protein
MQLKLVYVGILGLIVTFVTLPQVLFISDKIQWCDANGLTLLEKECIEVDAMYYTMSVYFIIAIIVGVAGMLFITAGLVAQDPNHDNREMWI